MSEMYKKKLIDNRQRFLVICWQVSFIFYSFFLHTEKNCVQFLFEYILGTFGIRVIHKRNSLMIYGWSKHCKSPIALAKRMSYINHHTVHPHVKYKFESSLCLCIGQHLSWCFTVCECECVCPTVPLFICAFVPLLGLRVARLGSNLYLNKCIVVLLLATCKICCVCCT